MKKLINPLLLLLLVALTFSNASAVVKLDDSNEEYKKTIHVTGFVDYPPLGWVDIINSTRYYNNLFEQMLEEFSEQHNLKIVYDYEQDYSSLIREVRAGKIDVVLGIYHQTKMYNGIEYVFPAMIGNPITVIMMPDRIDEVEKVEDLKKLKGAMNSHEKLTDFVESQVTEFGIEKVDNSEELFKKLFTGEIDYVFSSQYFGIVETAKLGLRDKVSFSKQTLWNMPLFFGVSKMSKDRKYLYSRLTKYAEDENNRQKLVAELRRMIADIERQNQGVVPPAYSRSE